jgi:hypothetical protein
MKNWKFWKKFLMCNEFFFGPGPTRRTLIPALHNFKYQTQVIWWVVISIIQSIWVPSMSSLRKQIKLNIKYIFTIHHRIKKTNITKIRKICTLKKDSLYHNRGLGTYTSVWYLWIVFTILIAYFTTISLIWCSTHWSQCIRSRMSINMLWHHCIWSPCWWSLFS